MAIKSWKKVCVSLEKKKSGIKYDHAIFYCRKCIKFGGG